MAKSSDGDISPMREATVQLHEMYVELKAAGFSRAESMELLAKMMRQMLNQANEQQDGNDG